MQQPRLGLVPLALLALAACNQAPAPKSEPVGKLGGVSVVRTRVNGLGTTYQSTAAGGAFGLLPAPQSLPVGAPQLDSCTVTDSASPTAALPFDPLPANVSSLDAGDPLLLKTSDGASVQLNRRTVSGQTFYTSALGEAGIFPSGPLPTHLTLDIPGAEGGFPAFKDVSVPSVIPLDLTAPALDQPVSADMTFTWAARTAQPGDTAYVFLGGTQFVGGSVVGFFCFARDDGNFTLPATTKTELLNKNFTGASQVEAGRFVIRTTRQGDAAVVATAGDIETTFVGAAPAQ